MPWSNSVAITVDHTKVPNSDQSNFPLLFLGTYPQLAWTTYGGSVTSSSGYDLLFASDSAGASPLPFQRAVWQPATGALEAWVNIPTLSHTTDTTFYILFGNSAITTDQATPTSVWDTHFQSVLHMGGVTSLSVSDSTANGNGGVSGNNGIALPSAVVGKLAGGASYTGSQGIYLGSALSATPPWTISAWANLTSVNTTQAFFGATSAGGIEFRLDGSNSKLDLLTNNIADMAHSTGTLSPNTWTHVAVSYDASGNYVFYINGAASGSGTNLQSFSSTGYYVGYDYNGEDLNGILDEFRFSNIVRSADWLAAQYNNQNSPSTFYSTSLTTSNPSNPWGPLPVASLLERGALVGATGHQFTRADAIATSLGASAAAGAVNTGFTR